MDTQTRRALKQDSFVQATSSSVHWFQEKRSAIFRIAVPAVIVVAIVIAGVVFYHSRSEQAEAALGDAMFTYSSPLLEPGQPAESGSFASATERAKEANKKFTAVASQYSWLPAGKQAEYFAGLTYMELGQTGSAETSLKTAAEKGNKDLASLANFALAGLYHQSGRDSQAIAIYNQLTAKPTNVVPASSAQIALAELYQSTQPDQAKAIYAKIKDSDKTTAAGQLATQKLSEIK